MDLVQSAKSAKRNTGKKNKWTLQEILVSLNKRNAGLDDKEIGLLVDHPKNSVTYKLGRWLEEAGIESTESLFKHFDVTFAEDKVSEILESFTPASIEDPNEGAA